MINIPKGTKDILPNESYKWQFIEQEFRKICAEYNAKEIRTPTFEHTELFLRGVGDSTDIVNKEMYTFLDKGERSLTLKPEGTASVVRSFVENGLFNEMMPQKFFYITPAFRYEKPQSGRLREHHQCGVEFVGSANAEMDFEVISLLYNFLINVGLKNLKIHINSIGCEHCSKNYKLALKEYFKDKIQFMCNDCKRRYEQNPLRILDCKEDKCREISLNAPKILNFLCEDCQLHFEKLKKLLKENNIEFEVDENIIRGLDYYTKTVFEVVNSNNMALCGGGRYDNLIESLGGPSVASVGFGQGIERLLIELEKQNVEIKDENQLDCFVIKAGLENSIDVEICSLLRKSGFSADYDLIGRSVKNNFKYANKINAKFVIIVGEEEFKNKQIKMKNMQTGEEQLVEINELVSALKGK